MTSGLWATKLCQGAHVEGGEEHHGHGGAHAEEREPFADVLDLFSPGGGQPDLPQRGGQPRGIGTRLWNLMG